MVIAARNKSLKERRSTDYLDHTRPSTVILIFTGEINGTVVSLLHVIFYHFACHLYCYIFTSFFSLIHLLCIQKMYRIIVTFSISYPYLELPQIFMHITNSVFISRIIYINVCYFKLALDLLNSCISLPTSMILSCDSGATSNLGVFQWRTQKWRLSTLSSRLLLQVPEENTLILQAYPTAAILLWT
jgi:hypothetical protein